MFLLMLPCLAGLIHQRLGGRSIRAAQQVFNPLLDVPLFQKAQYSSGYRAFPIDEGGCGESRSQSQIRHVVRRGPEPDRKCDFQLPQERRNLVLSARFIGRSANHHHIAIRVPVVDRNQQRHLGAARDTPRCPKIENDDLPPVVTNTMNFAVQVPERQFRRAGELLGKEWTRWPDKQQRERGQPGSQVSA